MLSVRQMLSEKGSAVVSITPDTSVFDALKVMSEKNIGAVLVMEDEVLLEASDQVLQNVIEEIDKYRSVSMSMSAR